MEFDQLLPKLFCAGEWSNSVEFLFGQATLEGAGRSGIGFHLLDLGGFPVFAGCRLAVFVGC